MSSPDVSTHNVESLLSKIDAVFINTNTSQQDKAGLQFVEIVQEYCKADI